MCKLGHLERDIQGRCRPEVLREEKAVYVHFRTSITVIETFVHFECFINQSYLNTLKHLNSTQQNCNTDI